MSNYIKIYVELLIKKLIKPLPDGHLRAYSIDQSAGNTRVNRDVPSISKEVKYPELDHFPESKGKMQNGTLF